MTRGSTVVLLLHAAAAFQFHEDKCEPTTSLPTAEDSKRVAFILRGDAYRGLAEVERLGGHELYGNRALRHDGWL